MDPQAEAAQERQFQSVHQAKMAGLLKPDEYEGLCRLIQMKVPVASLAPNRDPKARSDVYFTAANNAAPSWQRFKSHKADHAIIGIAGVVFDWIDIDVKNGGVGMSTFKELEYLVDNEVARVQTPSGGLHILVPSAGCAAISHANIDYLAGRKKAFLPGSHRSKYPGGEYKWLTLPEWKGQLPSDAFPLALAEMAGRAKRPKAKSEAKEWHLSQFYGGNGVGQWAFRQVANASESERHTRLVAMARHLGGVVGNNWDAHTAIEILLLEAAYKCGYTRDHGLRAAMTAIRDGLWYAIESDSR